MTWTYCWVMAVVDPGFPRRGYQLMDLGLKPIIWQDFCWKLHENEWLPLWIRQWMGCPVLNEYIHTCNCVNYCVKWIVQEWVLYPFLRNFSSHNSSRIINRRYEWTLILLHIFVVTGLCIMNLFWCRRCTPAMGTLIEVIFSCLPRM